MFNGHAQASALFEHPLNEFKSVPVSRVIHDFYDSDPRRGFYEAGEWICAFVSYPMNFAFEACRRTRPSGVLNTKPCSGSTSRGPCTHRGTQLRCRGDKQHLA